VLVLCCAVLCRAVNLCLDTGHVGYCGGDNFQIIERFPERITSVLDALAGLDRDLFAVIEPDLYPIAPHIPLAIQARAAGYFTALGLGPIQQWPY
jgi:inosose dehydratase